MTDPDRNNLDSEGFGRRDFFRTAALAGAGLWAATVLPACAPSKSSGAAASTSPAGKPPVLPKDVPPELALQTLLEGNARYVQERSVHPNLSAERRAELTLGQQPWSGILGCADSRVPPEIIFDVGPGDMFDVRVAGGVAGEVEIESLEYTVEHLHTRMLLMLGHQSCGAVKAVLANEAAGFPDLKRLIGPAVEGHEDDEVAAIKANTLAQREHVLASQVIHNAVKSGEIAVYAGYFDLATGRVEVLDT